MLQRLPARRHICVDQGELVVGLRVEGTYVQKPLELRLSLRKLPELSVATAEIQLNVGLPRFEL